MRRGGCHVAPRCRRTARARLVAFDAPRRRLALPRAAQCRVAVVTPQPRLRRHAQDRAAAAHYAAHSDGGHADRGRGVPQRAAVADEHDAARGLPPAPSDGLRDQPARLRRALQACDRPARRARRAPRRRARLRPGRQLAPALRRVPPERPRVIGANQRQVRDAAADRARHAREDAQVGSTARSQLDRRTPPPGPPTSPTSLPHTSPTHLY